MRLSELLYALCADLPITVNVSDDIDLPTPEALFEPDVHHRIGDAVADAMLASSASARSAYAFGEWLAELCTGWATRFSNEGDIMKLDVVFGQAAYNDPKQVIRLYLLPDWSALDSHITAVRQGIVAAYKAAMELE